MMRTGVLGMVVLALGCAHETPPTASAGNPVDAVAEAWVKLALEVDTHEPGFVDAYFGPVEWKASAQAAPRGVAELEAAADELLARLRGAEDASASALHRARVRRLAAGIASARFRLEMIEGRRVPFADEAERLFGLRPALRPLTDYDVVLERIDALVPGDGELADRVEAFRQRFTVARDKLEAVMHRAIAECRARTEAHIALPADESFRMEFVEGKSWSAYNWYEGDHRSLIQVNTDLPITIERGLTLGCHEGYPGHHVQGIFNEQLYRERGWVEYSVAPLYDPSSPMNEGAGNYGVDLAFPGDERLVFERDVLYPLAGLDPAQAAAFDALRRATGDLAGARLTIAAMYLNGEIDRARAVELAQRYQVLSRERAEQSVRFTDEYRAYVINYSTGEDLVRAYVERAGALAADRWAAFERIMAEPTIPADLD